MSTEHKQQAGSHVDYSHLVQPFVESDPFIDTCVHFFAVCPERCELEARLTSLSSDGRVQSHVPEKEFAEIWQHCSKHRSEFESSTKAWESFSDTTLSDGTRRRTWTKGGNGDGRQKKTQCSFKKLVGHKDFRVANRPLGIRLSLKLEVPVDDPTRGQEAKSDVPGALELPPPTPSLTSLSALSSAESKWSAGHRGAPTEAPVPLFVRTIERSSFVREGLQIDCSVVWQGQTSADALANERCFEIELELLKPLASDAVFLVAADVDRALKRVRDSIGTLLLSTLQLQGLDKTVTLLPYL